MDLANCFRLLVIAIPLLSGFHLTRQFPRKARQPTNRLRDIVPRSNYDANFFFSGAFSIHLFFPVWILSALSAVSGSASFPFRTPFSRDKESAGEKVSLMFQRMFF
jgi:hypothetical protein